MMNNIECRVFKMDVGWGYALFHFPLNIEGSTVRNNNRTRQIKKENFMGIFELPKEYLEVMESDVMKDGNKYYFVYYMTKDI